MTNGGASFSSEVDIASGWTSGTGTCNPSSAGTQCGTKNSAFYFIDNKTAGSNTDGILFLRMRLDGDPRDGGSALSPSHWNFLLSITGTVSVPIGGGTTRTYTEDIVGAPDAKEFWIDVYGGAASGNGSIDKVDLFYANNKTGDAWAGGVDGNNLPGGNDARKPDNIANCNETTAGFHLINSFMACNAAGLAACRNGANADLSHTRVLAVSTEDPTDTTGEYYLDVQVPFAALTDSCGTYTTNNGGDNGTTTAITKGNQLVFDDASTALEATYSTSDSGVDPLQKDYIGQCTGLVCEPVYGTLISTPVTLSAFQATSQGGGAVITWSTATELGNLGFNIYTEIDGNRVKVNRGLIPSRAVNSMTRKDYSYAAAVAGGRFWIEELDIRGKTEMHGPFELGELYGNNSVAQPVPWSAIRSQHATAQAAAQQERLRAWKSYDYPRVNFRVTREGIYRVSYEDLLAAGINLSGVPVSKLALVNHGQPAPIYVSSKGTFGPGGSIEFFGEAASSMYTDVNVYQLQVDDARAVRLGDDARPPRRNEIPEAAYQATKSWDENLDYAFLSPNGDPWFRTMMCAYPGGASCASSLPATVTLDVPVDNYVPGRGAVSVGMAIWGLTAGSHHATLSLNGNTLSDLSFWGTTAQSIAAPAAGSQLVAGANQVQLRLPGDVSGSPWDMVVLDRYSVTYPRAFVAQQDWLAFDSGGRQFQVSGLSSNGAVVYRRDANNGQWSRLREVAVSTAAGGYSASFAGTGQQAHYLVAGAGSVAKPEIEVASADLALANDAAQYLIIAHPDFIAGLSSFVAHKQSRFQVKVADVEAVYEQFGDGSVDPEAIHRYIRHAVANLGTQYVLLVGGDSYDYKNYLGLGSLSFIPSLYVATDDLVKFAPSDPSLADLDGDGVPDVPIGRWPVRSAAELEAVVTKTAQYETKAYGTNAVLGADVDFGADADTFAAALPSDWTVGRAYLDQLSVGDAKALIKSQVNAGTALAGFVGHSGPTLWTYRGLFDAGDAQGLANVGRPTVVAQWGCWNSYYVEPHYNTLAHTFLVTGLQGAAAVLGTTTVSEDHSLRLLGTALTPRLAQPGNTIGAALTDAKRQVAAIDPSVRDVLLGWTILGDPSLVITP
ncbi:MAG TPA: C25 family cysteine peptidase [Thermoanaerobaculia bacterium]|nr:C25 family cysteine peptidase [Thermoanaerobaculia bacterium]